MASVFPDTSANNPDTGFAWADGDIWNDPDSGLTYSWYNPVWKTGGAGAEGNFVQIDGDNMTGDLTLGTDKITLDATAGEATFGGTVEVGQFADGVQGVKLHNGYVEATNTRADYNVFKGELNGSETSSIKADGSSEFKGKQEIDLPLGDGQNAVAFQSGFGGNTTTQIFTGGNASFSGNVTAGGFNIDALPALA